MRLTIAKGGFEQIVAYENKLLQNLIYTNLFQLTYSSQQLYLLITLKKRISRKDVESPLLFNTLMSKKN